MEMIITDDNFEQEVMNASQPVLIDFYADWCGPCKMMAPIVASAAEEYTGKLKVGKCNVDDNMTISEKYRIVSIPTFKIFKDKECIATKIGGCGEDEFFDWIDEAVK